ncbi:MAG: zinc dependent phospholipase C family protein [Deltaproteobacteria bacterium]|nr:zinc dependent phospholipase C family protein [Deltaproteobacteria bacterium]
MAGILLHVTLAREALGLATVRGTVRSELDASRSWLDLGAALLDIPYLEDLWLSGLRVLAGRDIRYGIWGTLLHLRAPRLLILGLLDRAREPEGRALALGALTHLSVDAVFHKEIERRVLYAADGGATLDTLHKRIEDDIDLHVHYERLGHSGIGTVYTRRALTVPGSTTIPWLARFGEAIADVHGNAPGPKRLESWRRGLSAYSMLMSWKAPWLSTLPVDDPELKATSLALADEAVALAARHLEAGASYLSGDLDRDGFFAAIPDVSLVDGGPALPLRTGSS